MPFLENAHAYLALAQQVILQPLPLAVSLLAIVFAAHRLLRIVFFLPFKGKLWKIKLRDDITVVKDDDRWNVIEIRTREVEHSSALKLDANSVVNDLVLYVKIGWSLRKCRVRIWQNQQGADDTIKIHPRLAEKLQISQLLTTPVTDTSATSAEGFSLRLRHPLWYFLIPFYFHPDPGVRLQWNMGFLFLFLGFIMPKLLDPLVAKALDSVK